MAHPQFFVARCRLKDGGRSLERSKKVRMMNLRKRIEDFRYPLEALKKKTTPDLTTEERLAVL